MFREEKQLIQIFDIDTYYKLQTSQTFTIHKVFELCVTK